MANPRLKSLIAQLITLLNDERPARDTLARLVHLIDTAFEEAAAGKGVPDVGETVDQIPWLLGQATVALGDSCLEASAPQAWPRIRRTLKAAERFVREFNDDNRDAFIAAATSSFPFGPGDGCLALKELGGHGAPGAGCASGAGFIGAVADIGGAEQVLSALRARLLPWLQSEIAPRDM